MSTPSTTGNLYTRVKPRLLLVVRVNSTRRYVRCINSRELYVIYIYIYIYSFLTSDVQNAFEKTTAGFNSGPRELIRTFLTRLTSVACFRLCNCDNILLLQHYPSFPSLIPLPRGSSACVTSHPERSSAVVEHRRRCPTYAPHTPAGICGPCV